MSLNKNCSSSSLLRDSRSSSHKLRQQICADVQGRRHTRIQSSKRREIPSQKITLMQARRSKSLAYIRLMAAVKMRVKPSKPIFKQPDPFHTLIRFIPEACIVSRACPTKVLMTNSRLSVPSKENFFHLKGLLQPRASLQEQLVRRQIEHQLEKRHDNKIQTKKSPLKRVQSSKRPKEPALNQQMPVRPISARQMRSDNQAIEPWQRLEEPEVL